MAASQIHGAYGIADESPAGRYMRDAKGFQIVEGSNQLRRALDVSAVELVDRTVSRWC